MVSFSALKSNAVVEVALVPSLGVQNPQLEDLISVSLPVVLVTSEENIPTTKFRVNNLLLRYLDCYKFDVVIYLSRDMKQVTNIEDEVRC